MVPTGHLGGEFPGEPMDRGWRLSPEVLMLKGERLEVSSGSLGFGSEPQKTKDSE